MPFDLEVWAGIAAMISAMVDVLTLGKAYSDAYAARQTDPSTQDRAKVLSVIFSTYSNDEIEAIGKRLQRCRDTFILEGAGAQRRICLCSVLTDVRDGNGGEIPVDEWAKAYKQLKCAEM